jgi:hypothetical protein
MLYIVLLSLVQFFEPPPHPIHLSMMEIYEEKQQLTISVTLFSDDFSTAIGYAEHAESIQSGKMKVNDLMLKYLKSKLKLKIDGKTVNYAVARAESGAETVTCVLKPKPALHNAQKIEVYNELMLELFNDQRNLVQARIPGKKEGALTLDKKNVSGVLQW